MKKIIKLTHRPDRGTNGYGEGCGIVSLPPFSPREQTLCVLLRTRISIGRERENFPNSEIGLNKLRGRRFARPQKKNKAIERRERFRQPSWIVPGLYNTRAVKRRRDGLLTCVHSARHLENGLNARALIGSGVHKRGTSIRQKKTDPHTSKSAVQHERHSSCPFSDTPEMRRRFDCPICPPAHRILLFSVAKESVVGCRRSPSTLARCEWRSPTSRWSSRREFVRAGRAHTFMG